LFHIKSTGFCIKTKNGVCLAPFFEPNKNLMDQETIKNLTLNLSGQPCLPEAFSCTQFTELAYLCHFVECYRPSMHIAGWQNHPVYMMEDEGIQTGIAFCDLQLPWLLSIDNELKCGDSHFNPCLGNIAEIWLVIVAKDARPDDPFFTTLTTNHDLSSTFDKIFHFDFFQSTIQIIK
jgi:hypothetical protein